MNLSRKAFASTVSMALLAGAAFGQSFSNPSPISIPTSGMATPYPSTINVSGLGGPITNVTVDINGLSHTFVDDIGMVLVGPTGAALLIMDGGPTSGVSGVNLTFDDAAAAHYDRNTFASGTWKPTGLYNGDSFPAPGPGTAYNHPGPAGGFSATFASTFGGTNGNGTWSLYVFDFVGGDSGTIAGGWDLNITAVPEPASMAALGLGAIGLLARRRNRK